MDALSNSSAKEEQQLILRKKQLGSSIKTKEAKILNTDEEDNDEFSLSIVSSGSNKSQKMVSKSIKKGLKKIHWTITPIFNQISQKEMLYVTGEILLDFDKKNQYLNKRSAWNDVKRISNIESDYKNDIIIVNFDQQNMNFIEFKKQLPRYLKYPDQLIHQFGNTLVEYEKIYAKYQNFVKLKINDIKKSEETMQEFQNRKILFDQLTRQYYKKLNDQEKYFFTVESFPNLVNNQYLAQKMTFNRPLCNLLGTNQQSFLHITQRNGIIEFYEFETMLAINKRVIDAIVQHFKEKPVNFENFTNFKDVSEEGYYKFFTYDEIEFYARIRIEYITLDLLLNSPQKDYKYDFYSTLVFLEPSQNTINQIQALRQSQKAISQGLIKELESDMSYTIQSEYFVNQIEKTSLMLQNESSTTIKVCGTKEIDSNSSSPLED